MRPALLLFGYALAVAWWAPALLSRLTARGVSPRLGLAAWLIAMASALASAAAALEFLVQAAVTGWSRLAQVVCRSVAGHSCAQTVYTSAVFELTLALITVMAALAAAAVAWRYGRGVQRAQRQTRAHAEVARITGRWLPGVTATVVLDSPQPTAYCVAGRPGTIVLTSGALALLEPAQLAAVLAHERAHLAGRHHLLIALTRGLAAVFPGVPLFARGPENVARLAEMCADDDAARHSGRSTLLAALLAMATGAAVPASALGAMTCAVTARLQRLAEAPQRGHHAGNGLALTAVTLLLTGLPVLVAALAGAVTLPSVTS
jgi:beta-lactamase regulating signal transducer with metallopeptidase domain